MNQAAVDSSARRGRSAAHGAGQASAGAAVGGRLLPHLPLALLITLLLAAPLPLGGNRPWAVAALVLATWLSVLLVLAVRVARRLQGRGPLWPAPTRAAAPLLALVFGYALWVALPLGVSGAQAAPAALSSLFFTQDPWATHHYLLRSLLVAGAVLLAALAVRRRAHVRWVLGALMAGGVAQAAGSIVLYAAGAQYQWFLEPFDATGRASGSFVNPDHLAGYLEITLAAGIGLMLALMAPAGPAGGWRQRLVAAAEFLMSPKVLVRLALVAMVMALVMTRSRMGNGGFFIGIVLVGALVAWRSVRWRRPALWLVASMVVVDLFVIGQWVGLDQVVQRMKGTAEASSAAIAGFGLSGVAPPPAEQSLQQRFEVPLSALPLVWEKPLAGWGGGGFSGAFPAIKPDDVFHGWWDHAHNDYVQVAVDTGLAGLLLWVSIGLCTLWRAWPLLADDRPALERGVAVAAFTALVCLGMHSLVDFNLQIPANALSLAVLLALPWVLGGLPLETRRRRR